MVLKKSVLLALAMMTGICVAAVQKTFDTPAPKKIVTPKSLNDLQSIVKNAYTNGQQLSVAGARLSQGGQTVDEKALMIDMTQLKNIVALDKVGKKVTVQTGITWKELLRVLQMAGLSIKAMQSYADFTVGGSLGVNAHGQNIHVSSVGDTVESFKIMMADGTIQEASPKQNSELFKLALGGYGLVGIITEVTLSLTDNIMLQKNVKVLDINDYPAYFLTTIKDDKNVALHSARLSVAPGDLFNQALVITYTNTTQKATHEPFAEANLKAVATLKKDQHLFNLLRENKWVKKLRLFVEKNFIEKPEIISRNNALAQTIDKIKNLNDGTCDILQEYFIPCCCFDQFVAFLRETVLENTINILNVTIRYVKPTEQCFLTYAPEEMFSFVLFINVKVNEQSYSETSYWTQVLIDKATKLGGTYYLPYHLFAPRQLLKNAYPQWGAFVDLKKKYDPKQMLVNHLYRKYA